MMRRVFQVVSWLSLVGTVVPSVLFLAGKVSEHQSKTMLLVATVCWFVVTPLWMGRDNRQVATE